VGRDTLGDAVAPENDSRFSRPPSKTSIASRRKENGADVKTCTGCRRKLPADTFLQSLIRLRGQRHRDPHRGRPVRKRKLDGSCACEVVPPACEDDVTEALHVEVVAPARVTRNVEVESNRGWGTGYRGAHL
jgi:hypothetical protein